MQLYRIMLNFLKGHLIFHSLLKKIGFSAKIWKCLSDIIFFNLLEVPANNRQQVVIKGRLYFSRFADIIRNYPRSDNPGFGILR